MPVIATIGTFDGFHRGHQSLLKQMVKLKDECKLATCLLTFDPHPRNVLKQDMKGVQLLSTCDEKIKLAKSHNIDILIIFPFNTAFSNWSPEFFFSTLIIKQMHTRHLFMGYDHRFGKDRKGDAEFIKTLAQTHGINVVECSAVYDEERPISSTRIRHALDTGDILTANRLLGYFYSLSGSVIKGVGRGHKNGYATANIKPLDAFKCLPKQGVYMVRSNLHNKVQWGMLNMGTNPTFDNDSTLKIEVHFFDFNADIYHQEICIEFLEFIRPIQKFDSVNALYAQIALDEKYCRSKQQHYVN